MLKGFFCCRGNSKKYIDMQTVYKRLSQIELQSLRSFWVSDGYYTRGTQLAILAVQRVFDGLGFIERVREERVVG